VDTITTNYWFATTQYSYYLIDDVSVVPIDLPAEAGKDTWVEQGKQIQIGRVGDTTAKALNCKWYHKGILIDSGAIISVNANAVKYAVDTYVVVQTICGLVKTDTVLVRTTGLGMAAQHRAQQAFSLYPNPNEGSFVLRAAQAGTTSLSIYDLMGRKIYSRTIDFATAGEQNIELSNIPSGQYLVRIIDASGKQHILKISVQ
jgi:hypothetical protein